MANNSGWRHRLNNIDLVTLTADCNSCGIGIRIIDADKVRCWQGRQKGGTYGKTKLSYDDKRRLFNIDECPICKKPLAYENAFLDHCHMTDEIRGYLCNECNLGLGLFKDDVDSLLRAIEYLKGNIGRINNEN